MGDDEFVRNQIVSEWHTTLKKGTDFDMWGQPVEAVDTYSRLVSQIKEEVRACDCVFTDEQIKILNKVAACLELRAKALQKLGRIEGISLDDLKRVEQSLESLHKASSKDFPVDVTGMQVSLRNQTCDSDCVVDSLSINSSHHSKISDLVDDEDGLDEIVEQRVRGTLLPQPNAIPNKTLMTVRVEKIGLKDAVQLLDPFITVSLRGGQGDEICSSQDTPISVQKDSTYLMFGVEVHVPVPLEDLAKDVGLFFELKHYKPKKKITSVRCWALMEHDEIKEGATVLELYKKPADFKRKKISLLTVKPLYLHVKIIYST